MEHDNAESKFWECHLCGELQTLKSLYCELCNSKKTQDTSGSSVLSRQAKAKVLQIRAYESMVDKGKARDLEGDEAYVHLVKRGFLSLAPTRARHNFWFKTFFVVYTTRVELHRSKEAFNSKTGLMKSYDLASDTKVVALEADAHSFQLLFGKENKASIRSGVTLTLTARSTKERDDWMVSIGDAIRAISESVPCASGQDSLIQVDIEGMRQVLDPGQSMVVPLHFFATSTHIWSLYIRPVVHQVDVAWSVLFRDICFDVEAAKEYNHNISCKGIKLQHAYSLCAKFEKQELKGYNADPLLGHGFQEGAFFQKHKVLLNSWLLVENALPYPMEFRLLPYSENASSSQAWLRKTLQPGDQMPIFEVDTRSCIQFRVPRLESGWSFPVLVKKLKYSKSSGEETLFGEEMIQVATSSERKSRKYEAIRGHSTNKTPIMIHLTLERGYEVNGQLRLLVYAPIWAYNFSDVPVLLKNSHTIMNEAKGVETFLPPNFSGSLEEAGKMAALLPALLYFPSNRVNLASMMHDSYPDWYRELFPKEPSVQAWKDNLLNSGMLPPDVKVSPWGSSISVATLSERVHNFTFVVNGKQYRQQVGVEVRRPRQSPFNRSIQISFRSRYVLVNRLLDQEVSFRQIAISKRLRDSLYGHLRPDKEASLNSGIENLSNALLDAELHQEEEQQVKMGHRGESMDTGMSANIDIDPEEAIVLKANLPDLGVPFHFAFTRDQALFNIRLSGTVWSGSLNVDEDMEYSVLLRGKLQGSSAYEDGARRVRCLVRNTGATYFILFSSDDVNISKRLMMETTLSREVIEGGRHVLDSTHDFDPLQHGVDSSMNESAKVKRSTDPLRRGSLVPVETKVSMPFYQMNNQASFALEMSQDHVQGNTIVKPRTRVSVAWDEPLLPAIVKIRALKQLTIHQVIAMLQSKGCWGKKTKVSVDIPGLVICSSDREEALRLLTDYDQDKEEETKVCFWKPVSGFESYHLESVSGVREPLVLHKEEVDEMNNLKLEKDHLHSQMYASPLKNSFGTDTNPSTPLVPPSSQEYLHQRK